MGQFSKPWEELNFTDNFIFCKVMKNESVCKQMLKILLGFNVTTINYIETEHIVDQYYNSRGIRLDVYVEDINKIYNIEMQTSNYSDLLLRARYYQSASDVSSTPRRTQFKNLKETYIIFLCKDDPFGQGLPLYTEKKSFLETNKIPYDDKTHKLFYNSSSFDKAESKELRDVLEFVYTLQAKSNFTTSINDYVTEAKKSTVFKDEYMYFEDILEEEKEEARATGLAEGRATGLAEGLAEGKTQGIAQGIAQGISQGIAQGIVQGIEETKISNAKAAIKKGFDLKDISDITGLTLEQVQKLAEEINK